MLATDRAQWGTRYGFILAALGAAIGLGNVWRFSYVLGENGGGVFLVIYLGAILLVGTPLLLSELAVGRAAQREAASAFNLIGRRAPWRQVGVVGVVVSFMILTYYAVISGWALRYFIDFGGGAGPAEGEAARHFELFTTSALEPVLWQAAILSVGAIIVIFGVQRGIELAGKALMPLLGLIVVGLAIYGLTLPGAGRGLAFMFMPNWSAFAEPSVYLAALGQAFFSLGLAMGILVTYGSYLPRQIPLPASALTIALGDTLIAILAGLVIFPAVFSFGMDPGQGPGLAFVTLPEVFARMTAGGVIGAAFFGLLVVAALTSLIALLEVPVAYVIEHRGMSRLRATLLVTGAAFLLGVPSSLGFALGLPVLDYVDFLASNVLLPASGLVIALFVGWHWRRADALQAAGIVSPWLGLWWRLSVRYLAPAMILIVLLRSTGII